MESPSRPHRSAQLESTAQNNEKLLAETMNLSALEEDIVYVPFAKDAFIFLQHRHNPVRSLTLEQYQGIFSGRYMKEHSTAVRGAADGFNMTNLYQSWKDVGGFGGAIKPFIRNVESGSEELMQTLVMKDIEIHARFRPQRLNSMGMIFEELESSPTGIAYSIYHYDRYMVFNPNTRVMAVNGVFPNAETIASGEYPLVYDVVLVHRKEPGERVERFVEWLLSEEGQALVRSVGYVPIR
jgi:phosphate transport system substrate-binding protein